MCLQRWRVWVVALVTLLVLPGVTAALEYYRPVPGWSERFDYLGAEARLEKIVHFVEESNAPDLAGHERWRSLLSLQGSLHRHREHPVHREHPDHDKCQ